jgi:hypothetical protein
MSGRDPWQPAARLAPTLRAEDNTPYAVRLPEDGSLLELARFHQVFGMPAGGPVEREFRRPRLQTALDTSLGGEVRLLGYEMSPIRCAVPSEADGVTASQVSDTNGCWLELVLYWQAEQKMDTDYTVFVHAVGPDGEIWAQRDTPPDGGSYPTSRWAVGEVIADPVRIPLPPESPPDALEVVVGMYRPISGQRLPVLNAEAQPVGDKVVLGPVPTND